jgi:hypothetical protein
MDERVRAFERTVTDATGTVTITITVMEQKAIFNVVI